MEVPVIILTTASHYIGYVDIEKPEDFAEAADKLWEEQDWDAPTQCHQCEAELGDWAVDEDVDYYFKEKTC